MKTKGFAKRIGALGLASLMVSTGTFSALAASSTNNNNNTATTNDLNNADIVDTSETGSITIKKYDTTSAEHDGVYEQGTRKASGEADAILEETLANYAVQGVEFTYLRVGGVETYSAKTAGSTEGNEIKLVYEIPDKLRDILELEKDEAVTMDGSDGATLSQKCTKEGIYHYTSDQLNKAMAKILVAGDDNIAKKNLLENYIEGGTKMELTNEEGFTQATDLDLGLYLIVETKVPEEVTTTVDPWFVQLPFTNVSEEGETSADGGLKWLYDVTCYPKNQTGNPTLDKQVRNAYSNSLAFKDKNGTVSSADSFDGAVGYSKEVNGEKIMNSNSMPIVHNIETTVKSDDTDDASYVANRGGYTEDGTTAGDATYSSDYTYSSTTTASEGDVLDYILVSKLPHISSEATYLSQYTFVDTLSEGIEYNHDARIALYDSYNDAMANNTVNAKEIWTYDQNTETYTHGYVDVNLEYDEPTGETQMTVAFTDDGLEAINTKYSDYYIVVYYTATVNSDATTVLGDEGNPNDVYLTWERTSEGFYMTLEDRCYVYTYGLNLTKLFEDDNGDATKVKFNVYNETDAYYVIASVEPELVNGKKTYYVTGKTTDQSEATVFSPDEDGALIINGLEGDQYQLTELETDDGYSLLKDQIVVNIETATRNITPAIAGYAGKVKGATHTHTEACYAHNAGQKIESNRKTYKGADGKDHEILICGYSEDGANGRTIGKVAMVVDDVDSTTATVDSVASDMSSYVINGETTFDGVDNETLDAVLTSIDSDNARVDITITNEQAFKLPTTGGAGVIAIVVTGMCALAASAYVVISRKKKKI